MTDNETLDIRPEVKWFAEQMEAKLRANDWKGGWQQMGRLELIDRIQDEFEEVRQTHRLGRWNDMADECVAVANLCMMLADNLRPPGPH